MWDMCNVRISMTNVQMYWKCVCLAVKTVIVFVMLCELKDLSNIS